jgi:hypothetical protein
VVGRRPGKAKATSLESQRYFLAGVMVFQQFDDVSLIAA